MRSNSVGKFFVNSIKKKPDIQSFFRDLQNKTIDDIKNAKFPLWYRERLIELKNKNFIWSEENEEILKSGLYVEDGNVPDPIGEIYIYNGPDAELKVTGLNMMIETGDMFFKETSDIAIGSQILCLNLKEMSKIISQSILVGSKTKCEYNKSYQQYLLNKHGTNIPDAITISDDSSSQGNTVLAKYNVRIQ